jgi:hypothetical protein
MTPGSDFRSAIRTLLTGHHGLLIPWHRMFLSNWNHSAGQEKSSACLAKFVIGPSPQPTHCQSSPDFSKSFPSTPKSSKFSDPKFVYIVPWWRYLLGITDSATQSFTPFIYFRLHRRYCTTVELEPSNSRTLEPSTLEPSNCRLSNSCIRWLAILFDW